MIYYLVFGLLTCCCFISVLSSINGVSTRKIDKAVFFIFSCILLVLAFIRDHVGIDYGSYEDIYYRVHSSTGGIFHIVFGSGINLAEPFYNLLNLIAPSFRWLLILCAVCAIFSKMVIIYNREENILLCLLLYFGSVYLFYDLGILRQGISIAVVWYSFKYIKEQKLKNFLFVIICATLFHTTAILAIPLYVLNNRKLKKKNYAGILFLAFVVSKLPILMGDIIKTFGNEWVIHKYTAYTTYLYSEGNMTRSLIIRMLLLFIFWFSIRKMEGKDVEVIEKWNWLYFNAFFLSIAETLAFSSVYIISSRGVACLYYCYIFLFSKIIEERKLHPIFRLAFFVFAILFSWNSFNNVLVNSSGNTYLPYRTIFN